MRLFIGLPAIILLTSCLGIVSEKGNGNRTEQSFSVDEFDKIDVKGEFIVKLTEAKSGDVLIEADENLFDFIRVEVRSGTLEIDSRRTLNSKDGIIVNIPVQYLSELRCSGASEVSSTTPIQSRKLDINLSGAGKLDLKIDAVDVTVDVSGATVVFLEGAANSLEIDMSGAGSLDASAFEVNDCYAQISGIGKILVNVTGTLDADVSGLGQVEYVGEPEIVKGDVSGIGNIERK